MKKTISILSLILSLFACVTLFSACGGDDDKDASPSTNPLVGTWYVKFIEKERYHSCEELTFNADFTCLWESYNEDNGRRLVDSTTGIYKVDGNTLTILYNNSRTWTTTFFVNGNQLITSKDTWTKK